MFASCFGWRVIGVVVAAALLLGCGSVGLSQTPLDAVIRMPGERWYTEKVDAAKEAQTHWEYAFMSVLVYNEVNKEPEKELKCVKDPQQTLSMAKWHEWARFDTTERHLRVRVWDHPAMAPGGEALIAVAFGGTDFRDLRDWKANLRWLLPGNDQYTEVVDNFAKWFNTQLTLESERPDKAYLRNARIHSTGHSLGGGLSQYFAYIYQGDNASFSSLRVSNVYAFDPSPVTGGMASDRSVGPENKRGLQIDRVFERGEILAILRSILSWIYPPPATNPAVRTVRYAVSWNLARAYNVVGLHNMPILACNLYGFAHPQTRPAIDVSK